MNMRHLAFREIYYFAVEPQTKDVMYLPMPHLLCYLVEHSLPMHLTETFTKAINLLL